MKQKATELEADNDRLRQMIAELQTESRRLQEELMGQQAAPEIDPAVHQRMQEMQQGMSKGTCHGVSGCASPRPVFFAVSNMRDTGLWGRWGVAPFGVEGVNKDFVWNREALVLRLPDRVDEGPVTLLSKHTATLRSKHIVTQCNRLALTLCRWRQVGGGVACGGGEWGGGQVGGWVGGGGGVVEVWGWVGGHAVPRTFQCAGCTA